ncbi:protein of unknown function [Pseudomonas cuatrocienegasensis]|uniref:DUF4393 domain-containing protein n=1 Tax=Pseudomonas cuatrocienegasensis TaxID=543360 RepID=A0ABY1BKJ1_9PSED|nr:MULTISPECIES: DUF4393 domain-containing protein [Pseudomonas]SER05490.1 protein of unknown function [Pseudomonas cuatrocienegasensis]
MSLEDKIIHEVTKLAPEVYQDLVKPAAQEVGSVAGRSAKALLSPVRAFLWGWEKIESLVIEGVNKRIKDLPEDQRKVPDPEIAVPLIQALSYTAHNETLREMYLNLLANSMNSLMDKNVHPSFVELIKQMNSLDAKVFDKLSSVRGYQKTINPSVAIKNQGQIFVGATPEWFVGWKIDGHDIFEISSSIVRLSKFGLIELMFDRTAGTDTYDALNGHKELSPILEKYKTANPALELEISSTKSVLYVNEYGQQFKNACK